MKDDQGVNITLQAAAAAITQSFQKLSSGVMVNDFPSLGGSEDTWL